MTTPDRRTLLQLAAAGVAALALPVRAQELGLEAVAGALALKVRDALRSLPAGREGSGVPIWILSSSRCGYCQKMNRERPGPTSGIETNYIAYPLADTESGAVAKAWRQRSIAGYRRFMGGAYAIASPVPVPRVTGRSPHFLRPDAELSDAQLFDKHYTEIHLIKSLWAKDGRIESVTPESYIFVRTPEGPSVIRIPGDGVPVLREMLKEYPAWFRDPS
jgi:hypothetical protein